jgi:hypothetical protein
VFNRDPGDQVVVVTVGIPSKPFHESISISSWLDAILIIKFQAAVVQETSNRLSRNAFDLEEILIVIRNALRTIQNEPLTEPKTLTNGIFFKRRIIAWCKAGLLGFLAPPRSSIKHILARCSSAPPSFTGATLASPHQCFHRKARSTRGTA